MDIFSFLLEIHLGVDLLNHRVILCLTVSGTAKLFSKVTALFFTPAAVYEIFNVFTVSSALVIIWNFDSDNSSGCEMISYCALICISLVANDVQASYFMCLNICISSLEKYLLKSSTNFFIGLLAFLLLSCVSFCIV